MVIIELPNFTKSIGKFLSDDAYKDLQEYLVHSPDMGDLIPKTGGLRKLRWASEGQGKRGGFRVIYFWVTADDEIIMVSIYKKSMQDDLRKEQYKKLTEEIS